MKYVWVGVAGSLGALSRYGLGLVVIATFPTMFPIGTLIINISGCFLLGLVAGLGAERGLIPPPWRAPIAIGFIGAYTTFSTWTLDTLRLQLGGHWGLAVANVVISMGLGLPAVWVGLRLSQWKASVKPPARPESATDHAKVRRDVAPAKRP